MLSPPSASFSKIKLSMGSRLRGNDTGFTGTR
jgi:hypothetical protein